MWTLRRRSPSSSVAVVLLLGRRDSRATTARARSSKRTFIVDTSSASTSLSTWRSCSRMTTTHIGASSHSTSRTASRRSPSV